MAVKTTVIPVEWLQVAGLHDPDGLLRVRRHARMGLDYPRSRRGGGRRKNRNRFYVRDAATARLIQDRLAALVVGRDAMAVSEIWNAMVGSEEHG
jgi:hypothetical protein